MSAVCEGFVELGVGRDYLLNTVAHGGVSY